MSEARALTNLIGNGVATVVVAKWENELNYDRMQKVLNNEPVEDLYATQATLDKETQLLKEQMAFEED